MAAAATACAFGTATAAEFSLESAPPVVVKTVPVAGTTDIDPSTAEIRVTFSKTMQDGGWSWTTWGEEQFPETTGEPCYLTDGRTCVLPVKLEPGKFYATWINSDRFGNFKDADGRPAVPYLLTFSTGADSPSKGETRAHPTADNIAVEHVALRFLAAIRDKEDDVLKELSVDRIKGWRDALPHFAFELRERFLQFTGKAFALHAGESLVEGDYAAVKCTGPKELEGKYLVLFFVRTEQGWRNALIRNSPPDTSLKTHMASFVDEIQKAPATKNP